MHNNATLNYNATKYCLVKTLIQLKPAVIQLIKQCRLEADKSRFMGSDAAQDDSNISEKLN